MRFFCSSSKPAWCTKWPHSAKCRSNVLVWIYSKHTGQSVRDRFSIHWNNKYIYNFWTSRTLQTYFMNSFVFKSKAHVTCLTMKKISKTASSTHPTIGAVKLSLTCIIIKKVTNRTEILLRSLLTTLQINKITYSPKHGAAFNALVLHLLFAMAHQTHHFYYRCCIKGVSFLLVVTKMASVKFFATRRLK